MRTCSTLLLALWLTSPLSAAEPDYRRDIRPILQSRCVACHGAVRQKGQLRLDAASLILKGGRNGPAVTAGKPDESLLIAAVLGRDRLRMPPEADGAALPEKEIALLRAWIAAGAIAPDEPIPEDPAKHWAFQPPTRSQGGSIDALLAEERTRRGTSPAAPADRATLLRRVTLDLIGVPPTREQLQAFLADTSLDAYERVVERLLSDPRHGERWGRHWMDVWRYSDPFGLGEEYRYSQRHLWRWRDWIIESLNADRGYDAMLREMLAGDEIAPTDRDTLRATGYLARNWYKFNRNVWIADTVEYTASGFLGLTFKCARCHDHKYDPISHVDYYRLRAFFEPHDVRIDPVPGQTDVNKDGVARVFDATPKAPTYLFRRGDERMPDTENPLSPGLPAVLGGADLAIVSPTFSPADYRRALVTAFAEADRLARAEVTRAEAEVTRATTAVTTAKEQRDRLRSGEKPTEVVRTPWFADTFMAKSPEWKIVRGDWKWEAGKLTGAVPGAFSTVSLTKNHPANLMGRIRYKTTGGKIGSVGFSYDVTGGDHQAVYVNAGNGSAARAFHRVAGADTYPNEGVVPHPVKMQQEVTLDFAVRGGLLNTWIDGKLLNVYRLPKPRQAGTFTLWTHEATAEFLEVRLLELPDTVALAEKPGDRAASPLASSIPLTPEEAERGVTQAETARKNADDRLTTARVGVEIVQARHVAEQAKYAEPRDPKFAELAKAAAVKEGKPEYTPLVKLESTSTGRRLALANWITARRNPLTARVAVNHIWMRHFGTPLVPSVANFGLAGSKPTHPKLLDWLAVELMESGWSQKRIHRLIVTSEAYRMSSANVGSSRERDPENVSLWRMNPQRMEAEVVRDSLLALAGSLDATMGGPILDPKTGDTSRRRSVYFRFNTEYKLGFFEAFDPASPTECYRRTESVVPQQALTLFNGSLALSQARRLARALPEDEFVTAAFEAVLSRAPSADERERCERFLREQAERYAKPGTAFPAASGSVEPASTDPKARAREDLIQVLFNHNDFVTIR